jgi:catechol 2,3-dioxygenase-like lactoylglutathione lyase family enzyme
MPPRVERVEPVLNVRDFAASTRFYARLGFVEQFRDDPDAPKFVVVSRDDVVLALQWHDFVGITGDRPNVRFPVDDVDGLSDEFGELPDRTAVSDTTWETRELHVRDADGNGLQFYRDRSRLLRHKEAHDGGLGVGWVRRRISVDLPRVAG